MSNTDIIIKNETDFKLFLAKNYKAQIQNFMGDEQQSLKFLSAVMSDVQRNQKLLTCTPMSLINSYMTMAQLGFMPSSISGEAYVIPYENNKNRNGAWVKEVEAQFQIGYQGLVTLFYKAGVDKIVADIVREKDKVKLLNGELQHEVDPTLSKDERGKPIGAYVIVTFNGKNNIKYMNGKDIINHAKRFSKSYDPNGKYSPWNPDNDPELWQWKKTVLKQHSKLLPKNETINKAIDADNQDSKINDIKKIMVDNQLLMGNFLKKDENKKDSAKKEQPTDNTEGTINQD